VDWVDRLRSTELENLGLVDARIPLLDEPVICEFIEERFDLLDSNGTVVCVLQFEPKPEPRRLAHEVEASEPTLIAEGADLREDLLNDRSPPLRTARLAVRELQVGL
jgi:hypothetical protein